MIHDLKPYPAMKDSRVPWLGQVPAHWEVRSLGSLTKARSERNRSDLPLLSVVREKGVILRDRESKGENHNFIPDDLSNYKVVREGDLVVNKMKAWQGSMGLAPVDGIVSPAYFVFDLDIQNRKYGQALLRSSTYVGFFAQASDGVRIGQWDLSIDGMKRIPVVIPEPDEQAAIVRFLEHADRRIRKAIAAKQKLIKLLQEQKQVIIHQAVTRGLDPNVKLKPSGVEWLGDVPEGWEVTTLQRCCRTIKTGTTPKEVNETHFTDEASGLPWFTPGDFKEDVYLQAPSKRLSPLGADTVKVFPSGTVMMIGIGATIGKVAVTRESCSCNQQVNALIFDNSINVEYATYLLRNHREYINKCGKYTTIPIVNQDETKRIGFLRPTLSEQQAIVQHIEAETAKLDQAIARTQAEISLLREYRTRLTADVVTGKLDVRDAAARLPEPEQEVVPEELDPEGEEGLEGEAEGTEGEEE